MTTTTATKPAALPLFLVLIDGEDNIIENGAVRCGDVSSRDEAIEAARAEGFEVIIKGGMIERGPGEPFDNDGDVWTCTVYAKNLPTYRIAHRDAFDADWRDGNAYHVGDDANEFRSFREACRVSDSLDATCDWVTCVVEMDGRNKPRVVYAPCVRVVVARSPQRGG